MSRKLFLLLSILSWVCCYLLFGSISNGIENYKKVNYCQDDTIMLFDSLIFYNVSDSIIQEKKNQEILIRLKDSIYRELHSSIGEYIKKNSKGSKVKPSVIIDLTTKHKFDISLLMAQARLEGNYGTVGRPKTTNSIFGVGLYDNGVNAYQYSDPNKSIEPYILLVKRRYLGNKRNVEQLLNGGYKNLNGQNYASATDYSSRVKTIRKEIMTKTSIHRLHQQYMKIYKELNC